MIIQFSKFQIPKLDNRLIYQRKSSIDFKTLKHFVGHRI